MVEALTQEEILTDMRKAHYVSQMRVQPTNVKFTLLLMDKEFARNAEGIAYDKIGELRATIARLPSATGERTTLRGWERMLAKIEESLYPHGRKL